VGVGGEEKEEGRDKSPLPALHPLFRRNNAPSFEPKQTYLFVLRFNIFYIGSVLEMENAFKKRKRF